MPIIGSGEQSHGRPILLLSADYQRRPEILNHSAKTFTSYLAKRQRASNEASQKLEENIRLRLRSKDPKTRRSRQILDVPRRKNKKGRRERDFRRKSIPCEQLLHCGEELLGIPVRAHICGESYCPQN